MTIEEKLVHKKYVQSICIKMLDERIDVCKLAIAAAQQASNDEEKSSAGDKFETSRAMNHLEKEMYSKQLQANLNEQAALKSVALETIYDVVKTGAFISCEQFDFYIAAGLGKTEVNNRILYLLSPHAPLSALLMNKKAGDSFQFNNRQQNIKDVY